jgi:diguanylate cyclase (GGDEF)-like protein/PAS domain S-box-containing protein
MVNRITLGKLAHGESLASMLAVRQVNQLQAALRETRRELDHSRQRIRRLADQLPVAVLYIDRERRFQFVNKTYQRWTGQPESALVGRTMAEVFSAEDTTGARYRDVASHVDRVLEGHLVVFDAQRRIDGALRDVELTYIPDMMDDEVVGFYGLMRDITERKYAQLYEERHATQDPLTGLASRRVAMDRIDMALARSSRHHKPLAVLTINLNKFRQINDLHGHAAGDRVLMQFADTLRASVRKVDTVARLGDDEFLVLAEELAHGESDAILIAEKVIAALRHHNAASGYHIHVTASIGIAVQKELHGSVHDLLAQAQGAMLQGKELGDSSWALA